MSERDFLPYTLQVVQPLQALFDQDRFHEIPSFNLNTNSDFHLVTSNIISMAMTSAPNEDPKAQLSKIFSQITDYIQDSQNLARLQVLEHTSKNFAVTLENSYATLTNAIAPTVTSLRAKIEERYVQLMTKEKAEDLLSAPHTPSAADYTFLTWDKLKSPTKQAEIVDIACMNANIQTPRLSTVNLGYILQKLQFAGVKELKLPADVEKSVMEKLKTTFATEAYGINDARVSTFWGILVNPNKYNLFCTTATTQMADREKLAGTIMFLNQQTNHFQTMGGASMLVIADQLSPEALGVLRNNLDILSKTVTAMQYWLLVQKELRLKGRLIITADVLNADTYEEFIRDGRSIVDIHNYIKAIHMDRRIPTDGVSAELVKSTDVTKKLASMNSKMNFNASVIRSKSLLRAYEETLSSYIKTETGDDVSPKAQATAARFTGLMRSKASSLAGEVGNLDKVLYDIVVDTFYHGSLVSTLYKYLGKNFDNLAEEAEDDITDKSISKAQCWATMEMLTTYLFQRLVTPPKSSGVQGSMGMMNRPRPQYR